MRFKSLSIAAIAFTRLTFAAPVVSEPRQHVGDAVEGVAGKTTRADGQPVSGSALFFESEEAKKGAFPFQLKGGSAG